MVDHRPEGGAVGDRSVSSPHAVAARDSRRRLAAARSIGDRFVEWQAPVGRLDPLRCPWVSQSPFFLPVHGHAQPVMVRALYLVFDETGDQRYKTAADRYAIFTMG